MRPLNYVFSSLVIAALFAASSVFAAPVLNGVAIHTELGKQQFIAGLYTTNLSSEWRSVLLADEEKTMQVRVLASRLSSRRFKRLWIEGMAINSGSSELQKHAQHMADFSNMLKIKLTKGDIFTVTRQDDTVKVSLNGASLGQIPSPEFFDLLLRTWIGQVPLSTAFKTGLLANGDVDTNALSVFETTVPSDERIVAVEAAVEQLAIKKANSGGANINVATAQKPSITKPKISAPTPSGPPKPTVAKPKLAAPTLKPKPAQPKPQPKKAPKPKSIAAPEETLLDEDLLEDEEDDLDFTAEGLLSQQLYIAKLKRWSSKHLSYPSRAAAKGQEGNVRLSVVVDRLGKVLSVEVIEEAPFATLTREATRAVKRASPFPSMPDDVSGDDFTFTLPVVFTLQR